MTVENVCMLLEYNADRYRDKTAIVHGDERISYQVLASAIRERCDDLRQAGVAAGQHVALVRHNGIGFVVDFFAIMRCGAVAILVNWRWDAREIAAIAASTDVSTFVCENSFNDKVASAAALIGQRGVPVSVIESTSWKSGKKSPALADNAGAAPFDIPGNAPALAFFTGGSTGVPKAAIHTHAGLSAWVGAMVGNVWRVGPDDILVNPAPQFHLNGMQCTLFTLCGGGTLVLTGPKFEAQEVLGLVEREHATQLNLCPQALIYDLSAETTKRFYDLTSVKMVCLSGAANRREHVLETFKLFPNASFMHPYGMTELAATAILVMNRYEFAACPSRGLSVGRAALTSTIKLLDDNGNTVPPGVPGHVWGKSDCMFAGYYGRDSECDSDGYLNTGDMLTRDEDGYYRYVGRSKLMVKTGGENVYCNEVENIIRLHSSVCDCVVFGLPDAKWGEAVSCAIELKQGAMLSAEEIIEHCRSNAAHYKCPKNVFFVDELPRNPVGKVIAADVKRMLGLDES